MTAKLRRLECVSEPPTERCWQWLFHAEAASLRFGAGYDEIPEERRPIVLGRIRFPKSGGMTLQTNSIERAIAAARFFCSRLGPPVVLIRCRVVNRCFAASEGTPEQLFEMLDQNVVVVDPRIAESQLREEYKGVRTMQEAEARSAEGLERRLKSKEDVPLVEDLPLYPEEETADVTGLANCLQLRLIRAVEHWRGNTDLTLTALIVRTVAGQSPARSRQEP